MTKNQWIIEDSPIVNETPETFGQQLGRVGTATGLSALKGLESIASFIPETLLGVKAPHAKPSEIIQEQAGLTPEYLEPKNLPESYLQRLASFAPGAITGGLGGLARTATGTGVATILGASGLPESVQDIGQLATEIGLGIKSGKIPTISGTQKAEYNLAKAAIKPGSKANASIISNVLSGIEKELGTEVSEKYTNKIKHVIQTVSENITKNEISPTTAMNLRKKIYKLGAELPTHVKTTYLEPLTKGINDFFAVYAAENPAFYKHLKSADKLTSLKNMNLVTGDLIKKLDLTKFPLGELANSIINKITNSSERFIRGISKNSAARKYYFDAVSAAAKSNPNLFINNINKLSQEMPELNQPNEWVIEN